MECLLDLALAWVRAHLLWLGGLGHFWGCAEEILVLLVVHRGVTAVSRSPCL